MRSPRPVLVLLLLSMLVAVACSSSAVGSRRSPCPDAWVRPPMGADLPAAGYLTIVGRGVEADALHRRPRARSPRRSRSTRPWPVAAG